MAWFVLDIVFKQGIGVSFKLYPDLKKTQTLTLCFISDFFLIM